MNNCEKQCRLFASLLGAMVLVALQSGCGKDDSSLKTETLLGQHSGVCYHYSKHLDNGVEQYDTTYNSILEFKKVDETYTSVSGCGATNNIVLPDYVDTVYSWSGYLGSQSYYWEIRISNTDKTIETSYKVTNPGGFPFWEQYTGKWEF